MAKVAGGFPDPELLAKYNTALPGSAERILAAFEEESKHRRKLEADALAARVADTRRGQFFGLLIGLSAVISGAVTASLGQEWAGAFIGGGGVIGLVSVFVIGRKWKD
jgi:uncharacterized membrane protein